MAARKRVPAEDKTTEHLTVNLTPVEMEALKALAADEKRSVNNFVKTILQAEIAARIQRKKPFMVSFEWPNQRLTEFDRRHLPTIEEVQAATTEAIAKGVTGITVYEKLRGGYPNRLDFWTPDTGWFCGRVGPKGVK